MNFLNLEYLLYKLKKEYLLLNKNKDFISLYNLNQEDINKHKEYMKIIEDVLPEIENDTGVKLRFLVWVV